MRPDNHIWVFLGSRGTPSGVFTTIDKAQAWIQGNRLSGTLTALPVDESCFDWAVRLDVTNLKPEKLATKQDDPDFIANFLTASLEHYHYDGGKRS